MKKLAIVIVVCFLTGIGSFAQIKLGVRGGLNFNNVKLQQDANERYQVSYDRGMGFHFGLTSQIQIFKLYVQPEFLFSTLTNEVTMDDILDNGFGEVGKQRFNKVDVPIQFGLKFHNFKIGAGPVGSFVVNTKSDLLDKYKMQSNHATVGYQMAAGFDFDKFNIELRYEGNLSKYGTGVRVGNQVYDFDQRMNQLILTTAIYF
jgi:hypothetical protein